jgi:hypothetical protein
VPRSPNERVVEQLSLLKSDFSVAAARSVRTLLGQLRQLTITDPATLVLYHETLLFLRAYPLDGPTVRAVDAQLRTFDRRIKFLREHDADLSPIMHPEISGIFGDSVSDTFSFDIVRWLVRNYPKQIQVDWDWFEDENRLADAWPRFMPLLEEDSFVEANIPYREWLRQARNGTSEVEWLVSHFNKLPLTDKEKAEIFNAQQLYVRWTPGHRSTRTGLRSTNNQPIFYQRSPLIQRRDVILSHELSKPVSTSRLLNLTEGERALDLARDASTVRYRELYGFTHGDPKRVFDVRLDRGLCLHVVGLPAERRLPLRTYHAAMIYRNAVPIGYFEGLSLCERMESGFNLYYTFREGETAWIYAQTLNVMRQIAGVTTFSLDPYQIGYENEEGIESGAFWFYRKLGFRSTDPALRKLTANEEKKLSTKKNYRSSAATLRKLARAPMIFELDANQQEDWDRFQVRNIGMRVQKRMAQAFSGDASLMRKKTLNTVAGALNVESSQLNKSQQQAFSDFALVLSLVRDLREWDEHEKRQLISIIRAKAGVDETRYLREMQKHERLRRELIKLGS